MKHDDQSQPVATDAPSDDDVLDVAGAMDLLHLSRNTVYEQCSKNMIPHRRIGRRIRFSRTALLKWLEGERP